MITILESHVTMHEIPSYTAYFESDEEFSLEKRASSRKKRPIDVIGEDISLESDIQHGNFYFYAFRSVVLNLFFSP
jgi:hypothetical protein